MSMPLVSSMPDGRRRGGLGAVLVDGDEGLVQHVGDVELVAWGSSG